MMCRIVCAVMLAATAAIGCGKDSSGPKGQDPTVQVSNAGRARDTVFFLWRDGQGIVGRDTIPPGATRCEKFLAQADSAYFEATISGSTAHYTQPWFDPTSRPAWTMEISQATFYQILVTDVSPTEPC